MISRDEANLYKFKVVGKDVDKVIVTMNTISGSIYFYVTQGSPDNSMADKISKLNVIMLRKQSK